MPIAARCLSTADFIADRTPAERADWQDQLSRDARQMACYKKGPSAKLGPDGDSGGHGGRRLSRSKQIRQISSVRIAL